MLGTGHAMVMDCFNTCFVYENENGKMLVDTGGGGQLLRQLRDAGISLGEINHIFVSHQHTDHFLGLFWTFRGGPGGGGSTSVYLHEDLMRIAKGMLGLLMPESLERGGTNFVTVHHGEEMEILGRKVRFFDTKATNVPQYGFVMTLGNGKRFVFHGDVPFDESNRSELQGAEIFMHEAFNLESEGPGMPGMPGGPGGPGGPGKMGHSTVKQAAGYAQSLGVQTLILVHGSDNDLEHRQEKYTAEARQAFDGTIYVPYDLDVIELN